MLFNNFNEIEYMKNNLEKAKESVNLLVESYGRLESLIWLLGAKMKDSDTKPKDYFKLQKEHKKACNEMAEIERQLNELQSPINSPYSIDWI